MLMGTLALVAVAGVLGFYAVSQAHSYPCGPQSMVQKTNLPPPVQFGAVTKYLLPQNRSPNAITVAPDGSVWFAELGVPGVAHLYQNGTLVEYRWPYTYPASSSSSNGTICSDWTNTWGIAVGRRSLGHQRSHRLHRRAQPVNGLVPDHTVEDRLLPVHAHGRA